MFCPCVPTYVLECLVNYLFQANLEKKVEPTLLISLQGGFSLYFPALSENCCNIPKHMACHFIIVIVSKLSVSNKVMRSALFMKQNTLGLWLMRISMVQFSIVHTFKKYPKYPAYAIFTT